MYRSPTCSEPGHACWLRSRPAGAANKPRIACAQVAACGTKDSTQFWLNVKNLKSRDAWSAGWLQRTQRLALADGGPVCKACGGSCVQLCRLCEHAGSVVEV